MTEAEVREQIRSLPAFSPVRDWSIYVWADRLRLTIEVASDVTISYDALARLAAALGTTQIDLKYEAASGDYSEYTPGDPSNFQVVVTFSEPLA